MSDNLDIQRTLKKHLDGVHARASIPPEVMRNAKNRRVRLASFISGAFVLLLGGTGIVGASLLESENRPTLVIPMETQSPAQEHSTCESEERSSYGETISGQWLRDLLLRSHLGAPGVYTTPEHIIDTGTALEIRTPAYRGITLYATLLPPPFRESETSTEEEVGRHGDFTMYLVRGDFAWESYVARSDEWQLSLIAYPGPGKDRVEWPKGVLKWLERAVDNLEFSPPDCEPSAQDEEAPSNSGSMVTVPNVERGDIRDGYIALTEAGFDVTLNPAFEKSSTFLRSISRYARGAGPKPHYSWIMQVRPRPGSELQPGAEVMIMRIMCPSGYYRGPCVESGRYDTVPDDAQQPFRLLVHCGLSYPLAFEDRFWLPVDLKFRRTHNPPDGFVGDGIYDEGTIRRIDDDTLIYKSSEGIEAEFEPTQQRPDGCD